MKWVTVLLSVLDVASVLSLQPIYFRVRELTNETTGLGPEPRIYGGREASEGQFPFMVFVLMRISGGRYPMCSASLVTPEWVLLAAHCVQFPGLRPSDIILVGGKANLVEYKLERELIDYRNGVDEKRLGLQERRAAQFLMHPKYDRRTIEHDVALIRLNKPFLLGDVQTIDLSRDEIKTVKTCQILGWGLTLGGHQTFKLNFVPQKKVRTTKMGCVAKSSGPFICLQPDETGICQGDSGSPLVCEGKVWGVASHFVSESDDPGCGDSIEEYYSELYEDLDWILPLLSGSGTVVLSKVVVVCAAASLWVSVRNVL